MSNPLEEQSGVSLIGPSLPLYKVAVDGFAVPNVTVHLLRDDSWQILVGNQALTACQQEAERWLPFLANAMAIAAGYTSHGENCAHANPYSVRVLQLDTEI